MKQVPLFPSTMIECVLLRTSWRKPWQLDRRRPTHLPNRWPKWIQDLSGHSGIYFIRDRATKRMLYIGESHRNQLKSTLCRHFYQWGEDPRGQHRRTTYHRDTVDVKVYVTSPKHAIELQYQLIQAHRPQDNVLDGSSREVALPF